MKFNAISIMAMAALAGTTLAGGSSKDLDAKLMTIQSVMQDRLREYKHDITAIRHIDLIPTFEQLFDAAKGINSILDDEDEAPLVRMDVCDTLEELSKVLEGFGSFVYTYALYADPSSKMELATACYEFGAAFRDATRELEPIVSGCMGEGFAFAIQGQRYNLRYGICKTFTIEDMHEATDSSHDHHQDS